MSSPRRAVELVAEFYAVSVDDILGRSRRQPVARARQTAIWLARELTGWSTPRLGGYFDRDHTTILYALWVMEARARIDPTLHRLLDSLRTEAQ